MKKEDKLIIFEQRGKHLLEGELYCGVCGFKGKADVNTALMHQNGSHGGGYK